MTNMGTFRPTDNKMYRLDLLQAKFWRQAPCNIREATTRVNAFAVQSGMVRS